ncbi:MAG: rod shape-determining protein [Spiroplasma sp.]|nr:rod shape-determining protein [Spiroplasma sp.]
MKNVNMVSIDLGTKNLIIKVNDQIVYDQPSIIVFDTESGQVFIGEEALHMRDKTPASKIVREPLANGVISDVNALIALLTEIFVNIVQVNNKKSWKKGFWKNSVVLVAIPSKIYRLDEDVLKESLRGRHVPRIPLFSEKFNRYEYFTNIMSAKKIVIMPAVKLATIGAGVSIWDSQGVFLLDIGAGTSDCSIIATGDIIIQDSITVAGNAIDNDIKKYLEEMHYISITREQAENIKIEVGLNIEGREDAAKEIDKQITIYGKSLKTGNPTKIILEKTEIQKIIIEAIEPIVDLAKSIILRSDASFARIIQENGLILTGGSALLKNIDVYLSQRLNLEKVLIAPEPKHAVIKGTEIFEMYKNDLYDKEYIRPSR